MPSTSTSSGVILVTGATSGIGRATALLLATQGHPVIATVLPGDDTTSLAAEAPPGSHLDVHVLDITSEEDARRLADTIRERHGSLKALVNNAGNAVAGFFEELSEDDLRAQFEVNVFGTARVTRLMLPLLRTWASTHGRSHLVVLSSMAGRIGGPALGAYHSSKFAIEGLFESLDHEVRPLGVRIVLVEPGLVRTSLLSRGLRRARTFLDPESPYSARGQRLWTDFKSRWDRTGRPPEEVARSIARALLDPDPPLRRPCGWDARILLGIARWMPEGLWLRLWRHLNNR